MTLADAATTDGGPSRSNNDADTTGPPISMESIMLYLYCCLQLTLSVGLWVGLVWITFDPIQHLTRPLKVLCVVMETGCAVFVFKKFNKFINLCGTGAVVGLVGAVGAVLVQEVKPKARPPGSTTMQIPHIPAQLQ
jgi:FtsH-binding integral membrane protein